MYFNMQHLDPGEVTMQPGCIPEHPECSGQAPRHRVVPGMLWSSSQTQGGALNARQVHTQHDATALAELSILTWRVSKPLRWLRVFT